MSVYTKNLKEDITVQTVDTSSVDDRGLYSSSWTTSTTTKGRLVTQRSDETQENKELLVDEYDLYIPASVTVNNGNRIAIGSTYYEIIDISIMKNRHGSAVVKRLQVRKSS